MKKCDVSKFTGAMTSVDVLTRQMDDLIGGRTTKAYQLASPANRRQTANNHDVDMFRRMIQSNYRPLLNATDYSYIRSQTNDCHEMFDVLLYGHDPSSPTHGYTFSLSRQVAADTHPTLGEHKMPTNSQYWRTDSVVAISKNILPKKHMEMLLERQKLLRSRCFGDSFDHPSVQHSFGVDRTHNLCCKLGERAREYADETGNPIGSAARQIGSENWSTCMGSNVCSFYAQKHKDDTKPKFASSPDLYKVITHVPANIHCEAYAAKLLSMDSHGTPGISTRGRPNECRSDDRRAVDRNTLTLHRDIQAWLAEK